MTEETITQSQPLENKEDKRIKVPFANYLVILSLLATSLIVTIGMINLIPKYQYMWYGTMGWTLSIWTVLSEIGYLYVIFKLGGVVK